MFHHRFQFKALELNKKILESAEDLKKPSVKEPTVPESFELQIEKRLQDRQIGKKPQEGEEKPHAFKHQPLPRKILEGVVVSSDPARATWLRGNAQLIIRTHVLLSTGITRQESAAYHCARVSSLCPQKEDSYGPQG